VADADVDDLRKLLEACDQMLDHYCAEGRADRADDPVVRVMRKSRRRLEERLRSAEAAQVAASRAD